MFPTACAYNGMVVTPHRLASQAGLAVLRQGGNAVEAAVASAAALCAVYPHMTGIGGDAFWLILPGPEQNAGVEPVFIDACGRSALGVSRGWYESRGMAAIPKRGPGAALTMAGAVSGWQAALDLAAAWPARDRPPLALSALFADAISHAENGFPVSRSQHELTAAMFPELANQPGFARHFLVRGQTPPENSRLALPALARTFRRLAEYGLDDFYLGLLAKEMAADLKEAGSPLSFDDFTAHRAVIRPALTVRLNGARLFNSPPPTQGAASLAILALLERFRNQAGLDLRDQATLVHALVECTKQAFLLRDRHIGDPDHMDRPGQSLLDAETLAPLAAALAPDKALPWPRAAVPGGDTVWFGVMDRHGNTVSCIQSVYHEFGSGVVLPQSGIAWQNRGLSFAFDPGLPNSLAPGKKPFHTLNPALALFDDGRILSYGTMGGEGQPQTQAAVFARYALLNFPLQQAVSAPRWLLGRTWGDSSTNLKLEADLDPAVPVTLKSMGHAVEIVPPRSIMMGHAGALVRHPDGLMEGAADPRGDGTASCW